MVIAGRIAALDESINGQNGSKLIGGGSSLRHQFSLAQFKHSQSAAVSPTDMELSSFHNGLESSLDSVALGGGDHLNHLAKKGNLPVRNNSIGHPSPVSSSRLSPTTDLSLITSSTAQNFHLTGSTRSQQVASSKQNSYSSNNTLSTLGAPFSPPGQVSKQALSINSTPSYVNAPPLLSQPNFRTNSPSLGSGHNTMSVQSPSVAYLPQSKYPSSSASPGLKPEPPARTSSSLSHSASAATAAAAATSQ